ncbi:diguanylate cyclase/phosphodiesterase (GGDEF & EAL domains) with PAS/PAC sensor(s) [hydrothermal vent metagenome]|uniref:Diguanylate cyclase DosC n=1 Tax=hydrothermal vent metagenome TaxID=652676 RepID=A0A3B1ANQ5_9ZZZZ
MPITLCEKYGFDEQGRLSRLALVRLLNESTAKADIEKNKVIFLKLHQLIIKPYITEIIEQFYQYLLAHEAMRKFLHDDALISSLKQTQKQYLLTLGIDFNSKQYFENRLRIGIAHAKFFLPLSLYQCAYNNLQEIICFYINSNSELSDTEKELYCNYLHRMITLDESLAIDTYFAANMQNLESSIEILRDKGEALKQQVEHDTLTNVHSRKKILEYIEHNIARFETDGTPLALAMVDLDKFKSINDKYGHLVGDEVLKHTASRINGALRNIDVVGRYGGEEFIILLPNTNLDTAIIICERIRAAIAEAPVKYGDSLIYTTISLGVTIVTNGDTINSIIERADALMYQSKQKGRNCVTWN